MAKKLIESKNVWYIVGTSDITGNRVYWIAGRAGAGGTSAKWTKTVSKAHAYVSKQTAKDAIEYQDDKLKYVFSAWGTAHDVHVICFELDYLEHTDEG